MTTESKGSLDRAVQMVLKQLHSSINWLLSAIVLCFTFSYHTRLQTATILPIKAIARSSNDPEKLKAAFGYFKWRKQSDLQFARAASTLSAIAAVGVFSWQGADTAFWVAKVFWYWGLIFSFFSLISSTIDQMLAWIPGAGNTNVCHDDRLAVMPLLSVPSTIRPTGGSVFSAEEYEPSWWMAYVWQCPTMLMNWSWVMFFAGFILYILTPVIPGNSQEHELHLIIAVVVVSMLAIVNFFLCGFLTNRALALSIRNREKNGKSMDVCFGDMPGDGYALANIIFRPPLR